MKKNTKKGIWLKKTIFYYSLCMTGLIIFMSGLTACDQTASGEIAKVEEGEEGETAAKPDRKYPGANDRMVYIHQKGDVLQQWSLEGKKQKSITLPVKKYDESGEYELLWVGNDEILWSVNVGNEDHILSTPLRQSESGEEVLTEQTKKLFAVNFLMSIEVDVEFDDQRQGIIYVDENRILFWGYNELYEYNRRTKKGPYQIKDPDKSEGDFLCANSAMMLGDRIVYHTGRTSGKLERSAYEFWCQDLASSERKQIDDRCYTDAAYVTDEMRHKLYYQITDDQSIWEYDSATEKKKELISENDFKECYNKNQISWDDAWCDDALFVQGDRLYYVKNKKDPLLFSYSFTDGSLSFEKELTDAVQRSGYLDMSMAELTVVSGKLLLVCPENDELEACYICIDLQTAQMKAVGWEDPEIIYFGMLGVWDPDYDYNTGETWEKKKEKRKEDPVAGTDRAETVKDQIALISSQSDQWLKISDGEPWDYYYAVTDLDHNGRLEIIASSGTQGTGRFTTSEYYQISMDGTRLRCVHNEGGSDTDIVNGIRTAYVDPGTDTYYYCVTDFVSAGVGERYVNYGAMILKDGWITNCTYVDGMCTWNKKKKEEVWHYSRYRDGKEVKLKEKIMDPDLLDSLAGKFFEGLEKKKVTISWFHIGEDAKLSKKKIRKMVENSYKKFKVR